jgi:hypothetical protein
LRIRIIALTLGLILALTPCLVTAAEAQTWTNAQCMAAQQATLTQCNSDAGVVAIACDGVCFTGSLACIALSAGFGLLLCLAAQAACELLCAAVLNQQLNACQAAYTNGVGGCPPPAPPVG